MRMFVCLCRAVTSDVIGEAIARGARTSRAVADACGAGTDCGRCRQTVRAIITAMDERDLSRSDTARRHHRAMSAPRGGLPDA
jgi:bacterioferritin-associated ferredoxin